MAYHTVQILMSCTLQKIIGTYIVIIHYRGLYRGFRDTGYLSFYFQGYRILSILLPGIWDSWYNIFVTSRDIEILGKLIMGMFANL